ncbi:MAG: GldG family protein [Acidobacteriota bacterium]
MSRARILTTSTTAIAIVLAVALTLMVNWLGYRHYYRADWTAAKMYTLSDKTLSTLKGLQNEVRVIVFMTPQTPLFEDTKELLQRYAAASPKIKVEFIDPDREPLRTQQLAQEFGVSAANTVVFAAADRKKYVTSDQLAEYDYSGFQMGQQPRMKGFKGEEQFTSAILGVDNPRQPKVCFVSGHGERPLDDFSRDGLSQFKEALLRDNIQAESVTLFGGEVAEGCDALVIAGPTAPYTEVEKSALATFLGNGGRLLVLLDPMLGGQQQPSGLEPLLEAHGVKSVNSVVVDPARRLPFFDLSAVYASDFRSHPVTTGLDGLAVLLPVARAVTTVEAEGASSSILLTTSEAGWGETDLSRLLSSGQAGKDSTDVAGPVSLAVAAQAEGETKPAWRLVVVGDADFLTNDYLVNAGNRSFALNAVGWLVQREAALGIAPRQPEQVSLFLSQAQMRTITLISLVGLPGLAIAVGVIVWWRRRR